VFDHEGAQQIVEVIVDLLHGGNLGFGNHQARPCGWYESLTHAQFIAELLKLTAVERLLRYVGGGPAANPVETLAEINPAQAAALRAIVDRFDRWGGLVRAGPGAPTACLDDVDRRLRSWVERQLPHDCRGRFAKPGELNRIIAALRAAFLTRLKCYEYEQDPFVWAKLSLLRTLRQEIEPCIQAHRQELLYPGLDEALRVEARALAATLETEFGIVDIDPADVAEHVWWRLARAPTAEYAAYAGQPGQLVEWARSLVRDEIKLQAASHWRPDFLFDWDEP
jgi:hypothetical protein